MTEIRLQEKTGEKFTRDSPFPKKIIYIINFTYIKKN